MARVTPAAATQPPERRFAARARPAPTSPQQRRRQSQPLYKRSPRFARPRSRVRIPCIGWRFHGPAAATQPPEGRVAARPAPTSPINQKSTPDWTFAEFIRALADHVLAPDVTYVYRYLAKSTDEDIMQMIPADPATIASARATACAPTL